MLRKEVQHLHISCQNLTHENKMQRQGLLKEIRRYIGPKVNIDTCDCPLIESQWLFTESASSVDSNCVSTVKVHMVSQTSSVAKIVDTPTQISSFVLPYLSSLAENMSRSHQKSSCKEKVIFQHYSPLLDVQQSGFDMVSHSVIEQNTSIGSFCSTETLVMRTTQCSQQMSSIVLCPSVSDVSAISVLDRVSGNSDNKLVTTSLPCVQYQMGEHSNTQGGYLHACSEPKSYPLVKTRVFWNSNYEPPKSRASEAVKDVKSHELQHTSVKTKHSKKKCFMHGCHVETSNLFEDIYLTLFQKKHSYP